MAICSLYFCDSRYKWIRWLHLQFAWLCQWSGSGRANWQDGLLLLGKTSTSTLDTHKLQAGQVLRTSAFVNYPRDIPQKLCTKAITKPYSRASSVPSCFSSAVMILYYGVRAQPDTSYWCQCTWTLHDILLNTALHTKYDVQHWQNNLQYPCTLAQPHKQNTSSSSGRFESSWWLFLDS